MDELQMLKNLYDAEIAYSNNLSNRNIQLLTVLSIIGAGEMITIQEMFPLQLTQYEIVYCLFCFASVAFFIKALIVFIKTYYKGFSYCYVDIILINQKCSRLQRELIRQGAKHINESTTEEFITLLKDDYLNCTLHNKRTNTEKNLQNTRMTRSIIRSFIALLINFVVYLVVHNMKEGNLYV